MSSLQNTPSSDKMHPYHWELFFKEITRHEIEQILTKSQVRIEYSRGSLSDLFVVVSGIVLEFKQHICQFKIKAKKITSHCDCPHWNDTRHCKHVAALFIRYIQLTEDSQNPLTLSYLNLKNAKGARPHEFGTIINSPFELKGVSGNSFSFASLQFELNNSRVTNYPMEIHFNQKLQLSIITKDSSTIENFTFAMMDSHGNNNSAISLFEHTHLFDWENGILYSLPEAFRDFIRSIRFSPRPLSLHRQIKLASPLIGRDELQIAVNQKLISLSDTLRPQLAVAFAPSKQGATIEIAISYQISGLDNKISLALPESLKVLATEQGYLGALKKRALIPQFFQHLLSYFQGETSLKWELFKGNDSRGPLVGTLNFLQNEKQEIIFDAFQQKFISYECFEIKQLIHFLIKSFSPQMLKKSSFTPLALILEIPRSLAEQGLSVFFENLKLLGAATSFNHRPIKNWNSKPRFERNAQQMNWFDLKLTLTEEDLRIIKNANLTTGMSEVGGEWVVLSSNEIELARFIQKYLPQKVDSLITSGADAEDPNRLIQIDLSFKRARLFELFELRKLGLDGALTSDEIKICESLAGFTEIPHYDLPATQGPPPRPYQIVGHNWLKFLYLHRLGACLADDMGLGKTLQTILFIRSVYHEVNRILVICPVSLLINWEEEFKKFSDLSVEIYYGQTRNAPSGAKILLTSYGIMKKEIDEDLGKMPIDILVLDEVQHLKNQRSQGAKAARKLSANFRICLTGTPVENDLAEFYNILDLCVPGIWGDHPHLKMDSSKDGRMFARKTAKPFILRRTKDQVLSDLPPKIENHVFLNFSGAEKDLYQRHLTQIKNKLGQVATHKRYGEILKSLLELRQMCLWQHSPEFLSTKIDFLMDNVEQILEEGHQALIFSQFTTYLDLIEERFNQKTWKYSRIDGSKSITQRQKSVELFQNGKNPLFLISLKAGGVGLNLTAADYVFIMDPWWNPAVEAQAVDRAHRIGQLNPITVYRPIIKGTVEEKVLKLQENKKELFQDLLAVSDDGDNFSGKLTMADFESLFQ